MNEDVFPIEIGDIPIEIGDIPTYRWGILGL